MTKAKRKSIVFDPVRRGPDPKYPFRTMAVGEDFNIPKGVMTARTVSAYCSTMGRTLKKKFQWAHVQGGYAVCRTK